MKKVIYFSDKNEEEGNEEPKGPILPPQK